jgi:thymidine kinase
MLTVITGPMFAGKTTYLINQLIANAKVGRPILAFKPQKDDRFSGDFIQSHNEAKLQCLPIQSPLESSIWLETFKPNVIGFDEAQFFEAYHMQIVVSELIYKKNIEVIVAGLAQNSFGEPFGAMGQLMAMADEVIHLPAICAKCKGAKATRTFRKSSSTERVLVGGCDDYEPRCFKCWSE